MDVCNLCCKGSTGVYALKVFLLQSFAFCVVCRELF